MNTYKLRRPQLNKIDLKEAFQINTSGNTSFYLTMSKGQWDNLLDEGYFRQDATLIELDHNGNPINAYKYVK